MGKVQPTLGYPSQKDAIIAMYEQGVDPREIAVRIGRTKNTVFRAISDYRRMTGRFIPVVPSGIPRMKTKPVSGTDRGQNRLRMDAHKRAVRGARAALQLMQADAR